MIHQKGQNWNDYPVNCKRGTTIIKREQVVPVGIYATIADTVGHDVKVRIPRSIWTADEPPIFTQDRTYLHKYIPLVGDWQDDVVKPSTTTVTVNSTDKPKDVPNPEGMPGVV